VTQHDLQARIDEIEWYHDFDFGNGLRARSAIDNVDNVRLVWRFIEDQLDKIDFRGKSVLDIGAWDGYWSFYAERRGARSVVATDDPTQNWAGSQGIHLARELLGSNIIVRQDISIYDLAALNQQFDVILCLGVYYHLRDPFYGFTQIRHCCHQQSVVIAEGELGWNGMRVNESRHLHNELIEFLPSTGALERLLTSAYLEIQSTVWMHPFPTPPSEEGPLQWDRALLVCTPFDGVNESYVYKPHFGLHVYDARFRDPAITPRPPAVQRIRSLRANIEVCSFPESVGVSEAFTATVRVTNTCRTRWIALPDSPGRLGEKVLDYERAFLNKHIVPGEYQNVEPIACYREYIERNAFQRMYTLGVQLWDLQAAVAIDGDYARGFLAVDLEPGRSCEVSALMRAPAHAGIYALKFDMVHEYVTWFEHLGSAVELQYLNVGHGSSRSDSRSIAGLAARLQVVDCPEPGVVVVRAENSGTAVWLRGPLRRGGYVQIGVQLLAADGTVAARDWFRVPLPRSVLPGDAVQVRIVVPDRLRATGPHHVKIDLVDELRAWFEDLGSAAVYARC
jgi:tRNA (mo5U34)-methyltransferase